MYAAFVKLLNMSAAASVLIGVVLVLRFLLRKIPKKYICVLWGLAALRLVCPFSFSSALSAYNYIGPVRESTGQVEYIHYNGKSEKPKAELTLTIPVESTDGPAAQFVTKDVYIPTFFTIWAVGAAAMLTCAAVSYYQIRLQVRESIRLRKNIFICDHIPSPFILGMFRPKIYLPSVLDEAQQCRVIAHERAHLARLDHWWKPLGYGILCAHWFNPLVWLAYTLLCRDIEMACDERVIEKMTPIQKQKYAEVLLTCSMPKRFVSACPLAFGEVEVKQRIRGILNYRKPSFWVGFLSVVLCGVLAASFLSNPAKKGDYLHFNGYSIKDGQPNTYQFDMQMGESVRGAVVFAELWQSGELVQSEFITIPEPIWAMKLGVTEIWDGDSVADCRIQIGTEGPSTYGAEMDVTIPLPQGARLMDIYSWHGAKNISLKPDQEILLAADIFDCGSGGFFIFDFDNGDFGAYADRLRKQECALLVYASFRAKNTVSEPYQMITTPGPATIEFGSFHFTLPEGLTMNTPEWKDDSRKSSVFQSDNDTMVGGIRVYPMETVPDGFDWISTLDLPEWEIPNVGYFADRPGTNIYSIEFFSDVPPGTERTLLNFHNLYYDDGYVYDLWFDELKISADLRSTVEDTVRLVDSSSAAKSSIPSPLLEFLNPVRVEWRDYTVVDKASAGTQMTLEELISTDRWMEQPIPESVTGPGWVNRGYLIESPNGNTLIIRYDSDKLAVFNRGGKCIACFQGSFSGEQMVDMLWNWASSQFGSGGGVVSDLTLTQQVPRDKLSVLMHPTNALKLDGMGAVTPHNQEEWISAWNAVLGSDTSNESAGAETYYGIMIYNAEHYLEVHRGSQGLFLRKMGSDDCYGVETSRPLTRLLEPVLEEFHHHPVKPEELHGLQNAALLLDGFSCSLQAGDPKLQQLEAILTSAKTMGFMSACGFASQLTIITEEGYQITIAVATDSCGCYLSDGVCYEFPEDNTRLYQLFGMDIRS